MWDNHLEVDKVQQGNHLILQVVEAGTRHPAVVHMVVADNQVVYLSTQVAADSQPAEERIHLEHAVVEDIHQVQVQGNRQGSRQAVAVGTIPVAVVALQEHQPLVSVLC